MITTFWPLIAYLILLPCVHTECISRQPPTCYLPSYDPQANNQYDKEKLTKSIVYATGNLIVYESDAAMFTFEVNRSFISDVVPLVYVDGCGDNLMEQSCELSNTIIECRYNVTMADDGKKIAFYIYSPSILKGARLCHQPFSYLTVLGKPVTRVNVNYTFDNCNSIHLLFSQTNDSTYAKYKLLDHNGDLLLEDVYNSTTDSVLIPSHVLYNHTGVYRVIVTPTNPAGDGPSTELILDLSAINKLVFPGVTEITVRAINKEFVGQIFLKINSTCPLTNPNYIYVSSSCSDIERHEINMDQTLNDDHIILSHRLQSYKHNCSITVSDDTGNYQTYRNNISTFQTQSYDTQVYTDSVDVKCTFISGTTVKGCAIVIYNKTINYTKTALSKLYRVNQSDGYVNTGPIFSGHYSLHICDAMDSDSLHCPDSVLAFRKEFVISPSTSSSSPLPTNDDEFQRDLLIIISGGVVVVLIMIIIMLIQGYILLKRRKDSNYIKHNHGYQLDSGEKGEYKTVSDQQPVKPSAVNGHIHVLVTDPLPDNLTSNDNDKDPYDTSAELVEEKSDKCIQKSTVTSHVHVTDTVNKEHCAECNGSAKTRHSQPLCRKASFDPTSSSKQKNILPNKAASSLVDLYKAEEQNEHKIVPHPSYRTSSIDPIVAVVLASKNTITPSSSDTIKLPSKTNDMSSQSLAGTSQTLLQAPPSFRRGSAPVHMLHAVATFSIGGTQTPSPSIMTNNSNPFQFSIQNTLTEKTINEKHSNIPGICGTGVVIAAAASTNTLKDMEDTIIASHQHLPDFNEVECFNEPTPSQDGCDYTECMVHTTSYVNSTTNTTTEGSVGSASLLIK